VERTVETIDTLIIGAGPAGLTTAYRLAKAGHGVVVIEQDKHYVGGISRTVSYKSFLFDIAGHRFFSKSREVVALWNEILPDDFLDRPRLSRIYYAGKFYAYPLKAFEALRNLGFKQSLACLASYAHARVVSGPQPQDLPSMDAQRIWRTAFFDLLQDLYRKGLGHGLRCDFGRLGGPADQGAQSFKGNH